MTYQETDVLSHVQFKTTPEGGSPQGELQWAKMKARLLSTEAHHGVELTTDDMHVFMAEVRSTIDVDSLMIPGMETATSEERLYAVAVALLREVQAVGRSEAHEIAVQQRNDALEVLASMPDSLADAQRTIDAQSDRIQDLERQLAYALSRIENQTHVIVTKDMQIEQISQPDTAETVPFDVSAVRQMGSATLKSSKQSAA